MDIVFRSGEARPVILNTLFPPLLGFFSCDEGPGEGTG